MRAAVQVVKILVGMLFILSGLVKANDPLGLSYKMQEFFEVWNGDLAASGFFLKDAFIRFFHFLHGQSLALSVIMIALEIMAGIALIMGWQKKAVLTLLLVLIVFFTFLTGYAYASGKFKNCGCFGDCLPISPFASFLKDVFLTAAIIFLIAGQTYIQPLATRTVRWAVLTAFLLFSFGFQWYVLTYLPVVDCLPFKKGNNIAEQMKMPPNAVPDSFAIRFMYEKEGKRFEFAPEELPPDLASYKFVDRTDKLIRKGNAEPAIKGFSLSGVTNTDSTDIVLSQPATVLFFYDDTKGMDAATTNDFKKVYAAAYGQHKIPVYLVAASLEKAISNVPTAIFTGAGFFKTDFTVFRTAARTNPCIYLLKQGTIMGKWSTKETKEALEAINAMAQSK